MLEITQRFLKSLGRVNNSLLEKIDTAIALSVRNTLMTIKHIMKEKEHHTNSLELFRRADIPFGSFLFAVRQLKGFLGTPGAIVV